MIEFVIPYRLTRLNEYIRAERSNKYAAAKIKKDMTAICYYHIPNLSIDYPIKIKMIWVVKRLSNDADNVSFGAKFILDAMVFLS